MALELRELLVTPKEVADKQYLQEYVQPLLRAQAIRSQWLNDESIFAVVVEGAERENFENLAPIVNLIDQHTSAAYSLRTLALA